MKNLNENLYADGYGQAAEYTGVFSPIDAETVQGRDRMNPKAPEGLQRINSYINYFFRKPTLNPQSDVAELKSRLNHMNLDFKFDNTKPLDPVNSFVVSHGDVFGATPQTDLMVDFDRGHDLPKYNLEIRVLKLENGFKLEGKMTPGYDGMEEAYTNKMKRNKRIELVKEAMIAVKNKKLKVKNKKNIKK